MHLIGVLIIGFIVGLLGRALHPGDDKMGIILTIALGIGAALVCARPGGGLHRCRDWRDRAAGDRGSDPQAGAVGRPTARALRALCSGKVQRTGAILAPWFATHPPDANHLLRCVFPFSQRIAARSSP
jgi:hypothetical protein